MAPMKIPQRPFSTQPVAGAPKDAHLPKRPAKPVGGYSRMFAAAISLL